MRSTNRRPPKDAVPRSEERAGGALDPGPWVELSGVAWNESMKWIEAWHREMQRYWGVGLELWGLHVTPHGEDLRRASDVPWLPRLEAQVIPLRRSTDPRGAEATRLSMRVPIPWSVGGTNIVSLEAIVRRRNGTVDDATEARRPAPGATKPETS